MTAPRSSLANRPTARRTRRAAAGALILLVAFAAVAILPCAPAGAVQTPRLGIKPAHEANFFHLALAPGGRTTNAAVVSNFSDETVRVRVYAVDGALTPQGQFALAAHSAAPAGVGAWVDPNVDELTLAPRSITTVDFALAVPPGAAAADYAGGIVLEGESRPGPSQTVGSEVAAQLNIIERLGVRIYLKVDGAARPQLVVGALTAARVGGGAIEFSLSVRNTGNVQLAPVGFVELDGFGLSGRLALSEPELLLPGESATVRARWMHPPRYGLGRATARITDGHGHTLRSSAAVRLVPLVLPAVLLVVAFALVLIARRFARFVNAARVAIRAVNA